MTEITSIEALEALYGDPVPNSLTKVADRITPAYRQWIEASRFTILSTAGPEGTDGSPRGDDGPVAAIADERTIHLPDWPGNNRLDSLRNIIRNGRVSLMFMIPGCGNVVRVNGAAVITADPGLTAGFAKNGKAPKTVITVAVREVYFQCAKSILRSRLWTCGDESARVPTSGDFLHEMQSGIDAEAYDAGSGERAMKTLW